jgi:hypothetical protein
MDAELLHASSKHEPARTSHCTCAFVHASSWMKLHFAKQDNQQLLRNMLSLSILDLMTLTGHQKCAILFTHASCAFIAFKYVNPEILLILVRRFVANWQTASANLTHQHCIMMCPQTLSQIHIIKSLACHSRFATTKDSFFNGVQVAA